ncbi:gas vesicle structural protein, putative [Babesia ovis]|uniref:Gas vesicle structural protein, putative n=1 Tax=Babesia ovis TaxID=5869 RepID=A0A9W5WTY4_BABOV|nr:gas vesicle structural protein, putative [Babesia ovis]
MTCKLHYSLGNRERNHRNGSYHTGLPILVSSGLDIPDDGGPTIPPPEIPPDIERKDPVLSFPVKGDGYASIPPV